VDDLVPRAGEDRRALGPRAPPIACGKQSAHVPGAQLDFKAAHGRMFWPDWDYTDVFPENESLISPEWTAGGLFALKASRGLLQGQYRARSADAGSDSRMERDRRSMAEFVRHQPNSYAIGPGHGGRRRGQTGFGWSCAAS